MKNGLFIFHRDFRITDNKSLIELSKKVDKIFCCFIFTPEQVSKENLYKSSNAIQFMIECLEDLNDTLKNNNSELFCFYGDTIEIVKKLVDKLIISTIAFNKDFTPYAIERTLNMEKLCKNKEIELICLNDYYLYEPGSIKVKSSNKAYTKFSPFYNYTKKIKHENIDNYTINNFSKIELKSRNKITLSKAKKQFTNLNENKVVIGSRYNALKILKNIQKNKFKNYQEDRDNLDINGTTLLSAYLKFGCISVREAANIFKKVPGLYRQLLWREFYAHILNDFPKVLKYPLKLKYKNLKWSNNVRNFKVWCNGETGFPIVDAGIRELLETGYMHNRARLIVACFLVKTLLISWRKGEKFFANHLTDYDIASNNGNWQWVASTGADSQPYFRIFNPWTQGEKHDPNCIYIKKWIPELKELTNNEIHNYFKYYKKYTSEKGFKYVAPMVDYTEQRELALDMYKEIF
jgi:deoxyribodipyrimidine photo-lyase